MPAFARHIFICTNQRDGNDARGSCSPRGAEAILEAFRVELKKAGVSKALGAPVRANKAGCLDQCELGPVVVVYPENVWYGGFSAQDVAEIVRDHIVGGRPVERLRLRDDQLNCRFVLPAPAPLPTGQPTAV